MKTLKATAGEIKTFLRSLGAHQVRNIDVKHVYGTNSRMLHVLETSKENDVNIDGSKITRKVAISVFRETDTYFSDSYIKSHGIKVKVITFAHVYYYVNGKLKEHKSFKYTSKEKFIEEYQEWCAANRLSYLLKF